MICGVRRADVILIAMSATPHPNSIMPLYGWRAKAWAWVLFLALFKGLVPHAALAAAIHSGDPTAIFCNPSKTAEDRADAAASGKTMPSMGVCICASGFNAPLAAPVLLAVDAEAESCAFHAAVRATLGTVTRPPPACGPPV